MQQVTGHWDSGFVMVMKQVRQLSIHRRWAHIRNKSVFFFNHSNWQVTFSSVIIVYDMKDIQYISPGWKELPFMFHWLIAWICWGSLPLQQPLQKILLSSLVISNDDILWGISFSLTYVIPISVPRVYNDEVRENIIWVSLSDTSVPFGYVVKGELDKSCLFPVIYPRPIHP